MGAEQSQEEKALEVMPYAMSVGNEKSGQKCECFYNFEAYEAGKLIDRHNPELVSVY